jgi:NAD(P)H-dependent FMN reductase
MKIEIISGSPRIESLTRRVALHLQSWFSQHTSHEVDIIDMKDWVVPAVQTVWVSPEKAPVEFQSLAKRIFDADAYILVTPEYNGSYSPALKNLLDHFPKRLRKPFGLVTASPGAMGGMRASQQLLLLVPALFGIASPSLLIVPGVDKKFAADGSLTDETFQNAVKNFTSEFLWLAEKIVEAPVASSTH